MAASPRVLVVLHGSGLPFSGLHSLISAHGVAPDSADITTEPATLVAAGGASAAASYSKALVLSSAADAAVLGAVAKLLQPGGSVVVQLQGQQVRVGLVSHGLRRLSCIGSTTADVSWPHACMRCVRTNGAQHIGVG
jgi:hypothetical protein